MSASEIDVEPIPGLPADLPSGESIVWQGRPQWRALARNTFRVRWLAAYFALFAGVRLALALQDHQGPSGVIQLLLLLGLAAVCLGILNLMAWLNARATLYTITTRRIVLRIGVALPMTWNLPFKRLAAADLKVRREGDGDIVLQLVAPDRIAWLQLWPHTQPWHLVKARPTLRTIAGPAKVAALLADTVRAWAEAETAPVVVTSEDSFESAVKQAVRAPLELRPDVATEGGH